MDKQIAIAVEPGKNYRARITFADGFSAETDLRPALRGPAFQPLLDESAFRQMRVEYDTIAWLNGADVAPETLRYWRELGRVASQKEGNQYFAARQKTARVAEET
jgi:uncharacterized protein DUF2442